MADLVFPVSMNAWLGEMTKFQFSLDASIHDGHHTQSGSEMSWEQFLLLRVLHSGQSNASELFKKEGATPLLNDAGFIGKAQEHLYRQSGWNDYIRGISGFQTKHSTRLFPNLSTFSLVRYYQRASTEVPDTRAPVPSVPKFFSPPRPQRPKTRSQTAAFRGATTGDPSTPTRASRKPGNFLNHFSKLRVDKSTATPPSFSVRASFDKSPTGPDQTVLYTPSRDEQIVNTALLLFKLRSGQQDNGFDKVHKSSLHSPSPDS